MNLDALLSKPIDLPPAPAEPAPEAKTARRNILTVQGCSGCGRPRKQKVMTPFGVRTIHNRLKMTVVPAAIAIAQETLHPRRAPKTRTFTVLSPFCKECRKQALSAAAYDAADMPAVKAFAAAAERVA